MEKNARVEVGKTPSVHSGRPSEEEKDGEAVCKDELEKKASLKPTYELGSRDLHYVPQSATLDADSDK